MAKVKRYIVFFVATLIGCLINSSTKAAEESDKKKQLSVLVDTIQDDITFMIS